MHWACWWIVSWLCELSNLETAIFSRSDHVVKVKRAFLEHNTDMRSTFCMQLSARTMKKDARKSTQYCFNFDGPQYMQLRHKHDKALWFFWRKWCRQERYSREILYVVSIDLIFNPSLLNWLTFPCLYLTLEPPSTSIFGPQGNRLAMDGLDDTDQWQ